MNPSNPWTRATTSITRSLAAFCVARDAHHGSAWERLSVAYPDPFEALKALDLYRTGRAVHAVGV